MTQLAEIQDWHLKFPFTYRVICVRDRLFIGLRYGIELIQSHKSHGNCDQLDIGELLADTPVAPGSEWKIGAISTLANKTVTVINLLLIVSGIGDSIFVPTVRIPFQRIWEEFLGSSSNAR
jgi:hypothetical protein